RVCPRSPTTGALTWSSPGWRLRSRRGSTRLPRAREPICVPVTRLSPSRGTGPRCWSTASPWFWMPRCGSSGEGGSCPGPAPVEPAAREGREQLGPLKMIVLDAGHGGHDSGALGPTGLMEKDVVLDVTRRVAKLVEERLGVKVRLTRDADHFVTLRDRTSFANRERAD